MDDFMKSAIDMFSRNQKDDEHEFVGENIEISGYKLKVKKFIASGGFSNVFLACSAKGESFAVKKLTGFDKEGCDKILNEINLHKKLTNKNILKLHGVSFVQKNLGSLKIAEYLLLTEFCFQSLVDLVYEELSVTAILAIMNQAVNALNYLHNLQPLIIHRDIKLENYLISSKGELKLCDFGSATTKVIELTNDWNIQQRNNLQDEIFSNTSPMYRAPEILDTWNNYAIGPKVDIWAVGCVFFCILYKRHPFDDAAKLKIINGNYQIPNINKYSCFSVLINECLNINPCKRIDTNGILNLLLSIGQQNGFDSFKNINLLTIKIVDCNVNDKVQTKIIEEKRYNEIENESRKCEENFSSVQSFLNSNTLLSTIKDGANIFFKNFIGTSSKVLGTIQNSKTNNIFSLTNRIIISFQPNLEILQKFIESSYLPSNVSVYDFNNANARLPPPIRTIQVKQFNTNSEIFVLHLEHLYYLIEEMFGFLNSDKNFVLIVQENQNSNIAAVIVCALFLYTELTQFIEDALQIFAVKIHPISLLGSEFRYLNYIKQIIKGEFPHNRSFKFKSFLLQNLNDFYQNFPESKLLIEIFENNKLVYTQNNLLITNTINNHDFTINKTLSGNILIIVYILKNAIKSSENLKTKVGNIQFHTGFTLDTQNILTFSKEDIDLETNFDFNIMVLIKYSLDSKEPVNVEKWNKTQLKKDPKKLFGSLYEHNEILENFVGVFECKNAFRDVKNNGFDPIVNYPNKSSFIENSNFSANSNINQSEILVDSKTFTASEEPILLDLSIDNSKYTEENVFSNVKKCDLTKTLENNDLVSHQLLDIFDESFHNMPQKTETAKNNIDLFDDFISSSLENDSNKFTDLKINEQSNSTKESFKKSSKEKSVVSSEKLMDFDANPSSNAIVFDSTQKNSDVFADLLGQQGYCFAKKPSSEPKTINDLRKQEILNDMNEENIKIFKWTEGKRANIRALLCSMHTILWEDTKWSKYEMHQLVTYIEVKKAYRKACLAVHPDKHIGTEQEHLSKMIFMELNTAWSHFNAENL